MMPTNCAPETLCRLAVWEPGGWGVVLPLLLYLRKTPPDQSYDNRCGLVEMIREDEGRGNKNNLTSSFFHSAVVNHFLCLSFLLLFYCTFLFHITRAQTQSLKAWCHSSPCLNFWTGSCHITKLLKIGSNLQLSWFSL